MMDIITNKFAIKNKIMDNNNKTNLEFELPNMFENVVAIDLNKVLHMTLTYSTKKILLVFQNRWDWVFCVSTVLKFQT